MTGQRDPVEDIALLDFLFRGRQPDDDIELQRVRGLARDYRAQGEELETRVRPYGTTLLERWVTVPPIPLRC
jgi:hypothetical protein